MALCGVRFNLAQLRVHTRISFSNHTKPGFGDDTDLRWSGDAMHLPKRNGPLGDIRRMVHLLTLDCFEVPKRCFANAP